MPVIDRLYRAVRPLLFRMDAEDAHRLVTSTFGRHPWLYPSHRTPIISEIGPVLWGGPVGLAAGADKGGHALMLWERLGFGSIELGTVLPRPQAGNARPRIHRLVEHKAVVNSMGFPSEGMDVVYARLAEYQDRDLWPRIPVGINISKNRDTPDDKAHGDYVAVTRRLREFAAWITVNVSSPNTPGLRDLQKADAIRRIVEPVMEEAEQPVFVKLSPDMDYNDLEHTVHTCEDLRVAAIIATNTTLKRPVPAGDLKGGLSGDPLFDLALDSVDVIRRACSLPIVGVGGISSPARAIKMLKAGCSAVQVYTPLVYEGPGLVHRINREVYRTQD